MPCIGGQENSSNESAEEDEFLVGENGEVWLQLPACMCSSVSDVRMHLFYF
jgi:hypothetical protein